ncbi:hypothetical protein J3R83DRAFT_3792 [Lanmaoa asiatica]|nr:hypothetical protein J3R83DRAFT_3792 [Lanmaoa asiatica]
MPPRQRPTCVVCQHQASKYTCASCRANYCSVPCYKQHRETCSSGPTGTPTPTPITDASIVRHVQAPREPESESESNPNSTHRPSPPLEPVQDPPPLRTLTTLKWPYVPDTSAYPDPLKRDDPKPLQIHQYEAIATSPIVRTILRSNPRLCDLLISIDALRGSEREEGLQRALGVDSRLLKNDDAGTPLDEDTRAFRELAEAVEVAVRAGREDALGLDWD